VSEPEEWYDDDIVAEMHLQLEVANLKSRVSRYESAWKEVCALAQQNGPHGFLNPVNPYALLDIFNRMKMDLLQLEGS
jgi:hypothetical protein